MSLNFDPYELKRRLNSFKVDQVIEGAMKDGAPRDFVEALEILVASENIDGRGLDKPVRENIEAENELISKYQEEAEMARLGYLGCIYLAGVAAKRAGFPEMTYELYMLAGMDEFAEAAKEIADIEKKIAETKKDVKSSLDLKVALLNSKTKILKLRIKKFQTYSEYSTYVLGIWDRLKLFAAEEIEWSCLRILLNKRAFSTYVKLAASSERNYKHYMNESMRIAKSVGLERTARLIYEKFQKKIMYKTKWQRVGEKLDDFIRKK